MDNPLLGIVELWLRRYRLTAPVKTAEPPRTRPAVLVTGASEGIGLALARRFASGGHTVVLVARRSEPLEAAARAIRDAFAVDAWPVSLDVARTDAAVVLDRELAQRDLHVEILVNNAGVGLSGAYAEHAGGDVQQLVDLNVRALSLLMRHYLPAMLQRGSGGVLNVASLGGFAPGPWQAAYYASKAYVIALTEAVAFEARGLGVRIAVLAPGPVHTAFHANMGAQAAFYRRLVPAPGPDRVAWAAHLQFLWGRKVIIPGILTNLLMPAMRVAPHVLLNPIMAWLLRPRGNASHVRR